MASKYYNQGFGTLKLVVGKNFAAELAAIEAIHAALPCCSLMFDANEGYTAEEAIKFLEKLKGNIFTRYKISSESLLDVFIRQCASENARL